MQGRPLRIGTRGSPLALAQAHEVRARLMACHGWPESALEVVVIRTTGDVIQDRPLADVGGKGLFTKEIEEQLLSGGIDLAVHSMKDMQTALPDGLSIGAVLEREDVRDAFISLKYPSFDALPQGAVVGTSSLRRSAEVKRQRPDISIVEFRGNVQTRLKKLADGVADATFLACAGLKRLGLGDRITAPVPVEVMLPAVAQGAIGIEIRTGDDTAAGSVAPLNHQPTALCVTAERAFLARLEGSCRTPIGGLAVMAAKDIRIRGLLLASDGLHGFYAERKGPAREAAGLGVAVAEEILERRAAGSGRI